MEGKIINNDNKFKPFKLELEIQTIEEARLLWHIFNRRNLRESIFNDTGYTYSSYNTGIASEITNPELDEEIEEYVIDSGFSIRD